MKMKSGIAEPRIELRARDEASRDLGTVRRSITDIDVARARARRKRNQARRRTALVVGVLMILVGTLVLAVLAARAEAAPPRGSFSWNYKNRPNAAALAGAEYAILSTRGIVSPGVVDTLARAGTKPLVLLQPVIAASATGEPIIGPAYPWDSALYALATRHDAILRDSSGSFVDLFWSDPRYFAFILDLRKPAFVDSVAVLTREIFVGAKGIDFDYGCGDLSWTRPPGIDPAIWVDWRAGFARLMTRVKLENPGWIAIAQCDKWPVGFETTADAVLLEQAGWTLNPAPKVWSTVNQIPGRRIFIRVEDLGAQRRRLFAGIALLTDGVFNQCDLRGDYGGGTDLNARDLEHYGLSLGNPGGAWFVKAPNVYERVFARGIVIVNLGSFPYFWKVSKTKTYGIMPSDALTAQTRDERGRFIEWITDAGR